MNYFKTTTGERVSKATIDKNVHKAKAEKLALQLNKFGYNFCESCGQSTGTRLDCSHDQSVNDCQRDGKAELAWDIENITIRCRGCHQKKDGLDLQFKNK